MLKLVICVVRTFSIFNLTHGLDMRWNHTNDRVLNKERLKYKFQKLLLWHLFAASYHILCLPQSNF